VKIISAGKCVHFSRAGFAIAACLLFAALSFAQLPTAKIVGTVKDSSGASVPGAMVKVTNVDTNVTRTLTTDSDGSYNALELPTGNYQIEVTANGFKTAIRKGITLEVAAAPVINFNLEVGATEQQVTVSSEIPVVDTQDATLGGVVGQQAVQNLPLNGRNYVDLSLLQAGVTPDRNSSGNGSTSYSVNGAPPRSNNFTLDGAVTTTQEGRNPGNAGSTLGVDGVKEYKIITSDFSAEYGLAMGSQVVVVSKGGTNQFHGDAFEYLRNSAFDARNFFLTTAGQPNPEFQKNQYGGAFGGPIRKDKTFFFATYEGLKLNQSVAQNLVVPAAGCHGPAGAVIQPANCPDISVATPVNANIAPILALYPLPNVGNSQDIFGTNNTTQQNYGQIRVDQNFTAADSMFVRYTVDNAVVNTFASPTSSSVYFLAGDHTQANNRNQYITLSETHIFSPSVLNTARLSFSRTHPTSAGVVPNAGPSIIGNFAMGNIGIGGGTSTNGTYVSLETGGSTIPAEQLQNIYTFSDDVNWTRGKHSFKFGTLLNRWNEVVNSPGGSVNGQIIYPDFTKFLLDNPNLIEFKTLTSVSYRFTVFNTLGFYAQDDIRVTPRLTVNAGLRYEFMTTPRELNGIQSRTINDFTDPFTIGPIIKNGTKKDFSPRIGIAYDLFGNGKTAIRGGAGIYYDIGNIGPSLEQDVIGSPPFSGLTDITAQSVPSITTYSPLAFPLSPTILNTTGSVTPQFIDYDFKSPYMIQYNASVQQQLPWNMGLSVGYVGNRGVHLSTVRESNPIFPTSTAACGDAASLCVNGIVPFWDTGSPAYHTVNPYCGTVLCAPGTFGPSTINVAEVADSRYNALQVVLAKRTSHGLQFQTAYTLSRVMDDTQGQENVRDCSASAGLQGTYPLDQHVDWGPSCFNIADNVALSLTYHLPTLGMSNAFVSKAVNGWWLGSIATIQTGFPFSVVTSNNRSNSGVLQGQNDYTDINTPAMLAANPCGAGNPCKYTPVPYDPNTVITGNINQWYNPAMFSISSQTVSPATEQASCAPGTAPCNFIGQLGNSGRDILTGPPFRNWDFSLVKDTKVGFLGEAGLIQFRAEFFDVLNHPNFALPNGVAFAGNNGDLGPFSEKPSRSAGKITKTIVPSGGTGARNIQFSLRLEF
jgi:carboxypeptidase family protein/TonB-dependent receptor-like protein